MKEGRNRTSGKAGRRLAGLLLLAALMLTAGACGGKPAGETAGEDTARTPHIQPAQLTQEEQSVLLLRFYQDKTQKETAQALGRSQAQICRIEQRALDGLRARLA